MPTMSRPALYFAYGSNLCVQQMAKRCPDATPLGSGVLRDYRLHFPRIADDWQDAGVASVSPHEGSHVEGALYRITPRCLLALDAYEAVDEKHYYQAHVEVHDRDGRAMQAMTYFAYEEEGGPFQPSREYVEVMIAGAMAHGLSGAWLTWLRSLHRTVNLQASSDPPLATRH